MAVNPVIANTNYVNTSSTDVEYDFWSGVYLSTFGLASSNFPSSELVAAVSVSTSNFIASPPGLTDSFVSPNGEVEAFPGNSLMPAFVPKVKPLCQIHHNCSSVNLEMQLLLMSTGDSNPY